MKITSLSTKLDKSGNTYKVVEADGKKGNVFPKDPLYSLCELGADIDARWEKGEAFTMKDGTQGRYNVLARNDDGVTISHGSQNSIGEAMNRKQDFIAESQQNKDKAIRIASVFRDATLLTVASLSSLDDRTPAETDDMYTKQWLKWRDWLWSVWGEPHQGDSVPF